MVIGVRNACAALAKKARCRSCRRWSAAATARSATRRRRCRPASKTRARNPGRSSISSMNVSHTSYLVRRSSTSTTTASPATKHTRIQTWKRSDEARMATRASAIHTTWNSTSSASGYRHNVTTTKPSATNITALVRRVLCGDPVAHATYGLDDVRSQLLTNAADGHLDDVGAGIEPHAPHISQQLLSTDGLAGALFQMTNESVLAIGESHWSVAGVDTARLGVDTQTGALGALQRRTDVAHARADAGDQLGENERFGDVVGGTELDELDSVTHVAARRQDEHLLIGTLLEQ